MEVNENTEIAEWILDKIISSGGFGAVFKFRNKLNGECIAIKRCKQDSQKPEIQELWKKEVELFKNLNHPGLVCARQLPEPLKCLAKSLPVLCMEFCNSGDLRKLLNEPLNSCGLSERDVFQIARDISAAIVYLHSRGIVHRDLKPENIVAHATNGEKCYKLIDFGFAKDVKQSTCQTFLGTLEYMAPELFICNSYTSAVDYWSFGLIIHECITGVRPFYTGSSNWMPFVEKKTRDQICVCFRGDGTIEYSTKLVKENHLNSVHQIMFEEWLRSAVDFDPGTRGRDSSGKVTIFGKLETIVNTKVITVFWVERLSPLHYTADDSLPIETIHEWIERDTGIPRPLQLLITSQGHRPDPKKAATQLYSLSEDFTVFLLHKDHSRTSHVPVEIPELVGTMFKDPRIKTDFPLQRRMWAQSCFLLRKQENLLKKLAQGVKLFLGHATVQASRLTSTGNRLWTEAQRLNCGLQFLTHSLSVDLIKYDELCKRRNLPSGPLRDQWNETYSAIRNQIRNVESRCNSLEQPLEDHLAKFNEIAKTCREVLTQPVDVYGSAVQTAHELYAGLIRKPRDERLEPSHNVAMTKVLVKAIKTCENYFANYYGQLRSIAECVGRFDSLLENFLRAQTEVNDIETGMLYSQGQRQADIWALLEETANGTGSSQPQIPQPKFRERPTSLGLDLPLSLIEVSESVDRSLKESSSVIQKNKSLRYELQTTLTQSLVGYGIRARNTVDWSFLQDN